MSKTREATCFALGVNLRSPAMQVSEHAELHLETDKVCLQHRMHYEVLRAGYAAESAQEYTIEAY